MAAGRRYVAIIDAVSISAAREIFFIAAPTDSVVYIEEVCVTQEAQETSEQLPLMLYRTTTDSSAAGSANTPNPIEIGDPAFGGTVRTDIATGTSAETTQIRREAQNLLNGWLWKGSYEEPLLILSPTAGTASRAVVRLDTAPAAAITVSAYMIFREIGG